MKFNIFRWIKNTILYWLKKIFSPVLRLIHRKGILSINAGDLHVYADRIISDGILLNEIPSPTEKEEERTAFIKRRLTEFGIETVDTDDFGNSYVLFHGSSFSSKYILLYTDIDNLKYSASESIIEIHEKILKGIGIGDNSIGVSALIVFCEYMKKNNIIPDENILVLFSLRNTPESNFEGIRYFLNTWADKISHSIYLFGLNQGKLVADSFGISNLSFSLNCTHTSTLGNQYTDSAVDLLYSIMSEIKNTPWAEMNAVVNIVRVCSGVGFEYYPAEGSIDIEIFSKSQESIEQAVKKINSITEKLIINKNHIIQLKTSTIIPPANDAHNLIMNQTAQSVFKKLKIEPVFTNIPEYSSILNQYDIPSVSLGISTGNKTMNQEYIEIQPIKNGFHQILHFIDQLSKNKKRLENHG